MIDAKLERLFNTINFNKDYYLYFKNASVKEVLLLKKINRMTLVIEIDNLIPLDVFKELFQKASTLKGADSVKFKFIVKNNTLYFDDYFNYYFDITIKKSPMLNCIDKDKIKIDGSKIHFDVLNTAEKNKIEEISDKIIEFMSDMGFDNTEVSVTINEEERKKFIEEIEQIQEVKINKQTSKVIKGKSVLGDLSDIKNLTTDQRNVAILAEVFGVDSNTTQSGWFIITLKLTDYTDSMIGKMFTKDEGEYNKLLSEIKPGKWYKMKGSVSFNTRSNDYEFSINDVESYEKKVEKVVDDALVKRVELHAHTMMSQMDGLTKLDLGKHTCELISRTIDMGYKAVAITDHNGCQAFPICYSLIKGYNKKQEDPEKKFKGLFGTELTLVDDTIRIVVRPDETKLEGTEFVVYDTETTGFNAANGDQMIEIGAVKIKDGMITDRFDEFINPGRKLPDKIVELTQITDEMLSSAEDEKTVTKKFLDWVGNAPMVAHNAKFDISFIEMAMKKYDLGEFTNTVIDTLELSRALDQGFARHSLSALVKRYNVPFDEDAHHRADYDAEGTALVFHKMMNKLIQQNYEKISDLERLISKDEIHKFGRTYHFNAIALNREGLKNLFKIISLANTT